MQFPGQGKPPVGIIFDSDMGNRIDTALAMSLLYGLDGKNEARVVSISVSKSTLKSAALCEAIGRFYAGAVNGGFASVRRIDQAVDAMRVDGCAFVVRFADVDDDRLIGLGSDFEGVVVFHGLGQLGERLALFAGRRLAADAHGERQRAVVLCAGGDEAGGDEGEESEEEGFHDAGACAALAPDGKRGLRNAR